MMSVFMFPDGGVKCCSVSDCKEYATQAIINRDLAFYYCDAHMMKLVSPRSILCDITLNSGGRIQLSSTGMQHVKLVLQDPNKVVFIGYADCHVLTSVLSLHNSEMVLFGGDLLKKQGKTFFCFHKHNKQFILDITLTTSEMEQLQTSLGDPFAI